MHCHGDKTDKTRISKCYKRDGENLILTENNQLEQGGLELDSLLQILHVVICEIVIPHLCMLLGH